MLEQSGQTLRDYVQTQMKVIKEIPQLTRKEQSIEDKIDKIIRLR